MGCGAAKWATFFCHSGFSQVNIHLFSVKSLKAKTLLGLNGKNTLRTESSIWKINSVSEKKKHFATLHCGKKLAWSLQMFVQREIMLAESVAARAMCRQSSLPCCCCAIVVSAVSCRCLCCCVVARWIKGRGFSASGLEKSGGGSFYFILWLPQNQNLTSVFTKA